MLKTCCYYNHIREPREISERRQSILIRNHQLNIGGNASLDTWDPILISLVRRAMPNLIAYDMWCATNDYLTGLIFAMRARFASMDGAEALVDEAFPDISNQNAAGTIGGGDIGSTETNPAVLNDSPSVELIHLQLV